MIEDIVETQPYRPRITANGTATRQYHPNSVYRRDPNKTLLLGILWEAAAEYHEAKLIQAVKQVKTEDDVANLSKDDRISIANGKLAWEWFTQDAVPNGNGITFKRVCGYFDVSPKKMWRRIKASPTIKARLAAMKQQAVQPDAGDEREAGRFARGEYSPSAKLDEDKVRMIRSLSDELTQVQLAAMFGIAQNSVSRVLSRKTWGHVQ